MSSGADFQDFEMAILLEKSGPGLVKSGADFRFFWTHFSYFGPQFWDSVADFKLPIYRKVRFWIKGSRFWRRKA